MPTEPPSNAASDLHRREGGPSGGTFEERYSTAPVALVPWVLDSLDLSEVRSVADLGCGDGRFTLPVARTIAPHGGVVYAVDRSPHQLATLDRLAQEADVQVTTITADITAQPSLPAGQIDLAMVNFVLHLMRGQQVDQCLDHAAAALGPSGRLLVTCYGRDHMADAYDWLTDALVAVGVPQRDAGRTSNQARMRRSPYFTLDRGPTMLRRRFGRVCLAQYHDVLEAPVSKVEDLVPSLLGALERTRMMPDGTSHQTLGNAIFEAMHLHATDGILRIRSDVGTLIASDPFDA